MKTPAGDWRELFGSAERPGEQQLLQVRCLRKAGEDFLVVSGTLGVASQALSLYPARRLPARAAKMLLRTAWQLGVPLGLRRAATPIATGNRFAGFLADLAGAPAQSLPALAILAGNPRAPGRRYLVLLFDRSHRPSIVVKAGRGADAHALIQRETALLQTQGGKIAGVPTLRATFDTGEVAALAMDHFAGSSPPSGDWSAISRLLGAWLQAGQELPLNQIAAWNRFERTCRALPGYQRVSEPLRGAVVRAGLVHGDFAPWNIVVQPNGHWIVLDWERGEARGIPGWDWFHYVVQDGLLAERQPPERVIAQLVQFWEIPGFADYAAQAGIAQIWRELLLAYLWYARLVLRPAEGNQGLLELSARWEAHHAQ